MDSTGPDQLQAGKPAIGMKLAIRQYVATGSRLSRVLGRIRNKGDRECILRRVPRNAVCAETGVYKGDFSEQILVRKPRKLHHGVTRAVEEALLSGRYKKLLIEDRQFLLRKI